MPTSPPKRPSAASSPAPVRATPSSARNSAAPGHGSRRWIIDPIDGTKNFVRGVPVWATLIALVDEGEPVVGVVSAPALGKRWWAAKGAGAYTGRSLAAATRLKVSNVSKPRGRLAVLLQPGRLEGTRQPRRVPGPDRGSLAHPRLRRLLVLLPRGRRSRGHRLRARTEPVRHGRPGADRHRGRRPLHLARGRGRARSAATPWPPTPSSTRKSSSGSTPASTTSSKLPGCRPIELRRRRPFRGCRRSVRPRAVLGA